ncbi:MAG: hypothetical protein AAF485_03065 [Chloroflexota bacterium]
MQNARQPHKLTLSQPATYTITVQGVLKGKSAAMFDGLASTTDLTLGTTSFMGSVADQAALHGLLNLIRDLGLPLCSVIWIEGHPPQISGC